MLQTDSSRECLLKIENPYYLHTSRLHNTICPHLASIISPITRYCYQLLTVYKIWLEVRFQTLPFTRTFKFYFRFYYYRESCCLVRQLFIHADWIATYRPSEEDTMRVSCAFCGLFLAIAIVNCSPIVKRETEDDKLSPLNEVSSLSFPLFFFI